MYSRGLLLTGLTCLCSLQATTTASVLQQAPLQSARTEDVPTISQQDPLQDRHKSSNRTKALEGMMKALENMQDTYFSFFGGTWPDAIDWTAAVMGTHVSGTLSSLVLGVDALQEESSCTDILGLENTINKYFAQTSIFYFGEDALSLRGQAYDDMLWVVLGWLEHIKMGELYATKRWESYGPFHPDATWHGLQFSPNAAHRARIFYELASEGWDTSLCDGGMTWNPALTPYKNAITNELYISASVAMYLYFPGDDNDSPFTSGRGAAPMDKPHHAKHLQSAIRAYTWLRESQMQNKQGLYQDGFHITGWQRYRNGTIDPGTGQCDDLNTMVYTYNQGVILSANRGLWVATARPSYLDHGHSLVEHVIKATGWTSDDRKWHGLGRGGVMEDTCDHRGACSQDGQTFKGIFFHHLIEFCRPLSRQEKDLIATHHEGLDVVNEAHHSHVSRCATYGKWIEHNARAADMTKNKDGLFGMWWGISSEASEGMDDDTWDAPLPHGAVDYRNPGMLHMPDVDTQDPNRRGRGRTVETQSGGLAVFRARWHWLSLYD